MARKKVKEKRKKIGGPLRTVKKQFKFEYGKQTRPTKKRS